MKVVLHSKGGLGNQLIQYAFVEKYLSGATTDVIFDTTHFIFLGERKFHLKDFPQAKVSRWTIWFLILRMYVRIILKKLHKQGVLPYWKAVLDSYIDDDFDISRLDQLKSEYLFINGDFQHLEIFPLASDNRLKQHLEAISAKLHSNETLALIHNASNPIMLHLRRGDYVSNDVVKKNMGSCGIAYFEKGIDLLRKDLDGYTLFVFSDDIQYASSLFKDFNNVYFVKGDTLDPMHDFLLMRCFRYAIISNSTLSYMASMLSSYDDNIVVTPNPWFESGQKFSLGMKKDWKYVDKA